METAVEKRNLLNDITTAFAERKSAVNSDQQTSFDLFLEKGLPSSKSEEYKFAPIARTLEKSIQFTTSEASASITKELSILSGLETNLIVFVNGRFSQEQSRIIDRELQLQRTGPARMKEDIDPFSLLNHSFANETVALSVEANIELAHPVVIAQYVDTTADQFSNPRWTCNIGKSSNVAIIEYVVANAGEPYFANKHASISVAENAGLEYITLQASAQEVSVNNSFIHLASSARASSFTFTVDGQFVRNNLHMIIDGQGVDGHLYGLYLLSNQTLADNHTVVDHRQPNSNSNELYKGVMRGSSKGVFNGKIYVRPDAQKTNAFQSNRNILLSDTATVNTKPQLEIWADDVKCSHGCTAGQLDEEALFYLRSRGISKDMAMGMILYAFAAETMAAIKNETVKTFVDKLISGKLQQTT
ncbi:MAG: Fe-S cluster assembly protein SufD [Cyclobacteriaceae bacterium]|nr:Fe-S cluster assembly protein SufD [Cyclobacteriaceae bacterium]